MSTTTKDPPPQPPPPPQQQLPKPPPQFHHLFPQLNKPSEMIRYPLASSGRGLIPTHQRTLGITHTQLPEPVSNYPIVPNSNHTSRSHPNTNASTNSHVVRHPFLNLSSSSQGVVSMAPTATAMGSSGGQFSNVHHSLSKVSSSPYAVPESYAPKDLIDKKADESLLTIRDRKVRVSDGASLYALCRSWLRNGYPEDKQQQYGDVLISLPKPLPLPESSSPKRKERDDETNFDEVETDSLNSEELLASHVKRAKRVRARLREERSRRIERYKSRLALLLPPNGTIQE